MNNSKLPKHVSKLVKNGRTFYRIRKYKDGKEYQIFQSPNLQLVLDCLTECEAVKWDEYYLEGIKKKYKKKLKHPNQYITADDKGGYRIQKWSKGRVKYYGKASTLEHARKIRDYLIDKEWARPQYQKRKVSNTKYIVRQPNGKYKIHRWDEHYGTYNSFSEAIEARKQLNANNWDKSIVKYWNVKDNIDRYIQPSGDKYRIQKHINGVRIHFGTCNTLEEARAERDFFESINWDWDMLDLY